MKKKEKVILSLIVVCAIFQFIADKIYFGTFIYSLTVGILAVYFFPIKPFLDIFHYKYKIKTVFYVLASGFTIGTILVFSAIQFFTKGTFINALNFIFSILNTIFFVVEARKNSSNSRYLAIIHFLLMWFTYQRV